MSELDDLEEIDLTSRGNVSAKRKRNTIKYLATRRGRNSWKSVLRNYQTKKAKQVEK